MSRKRHTNEQAALVAAEVARRAALTTTVPVTTTLTKETTMSTTTKKSALQTTKTKAEIKAALPSTLTLTVAGQSFTEMPRDFSSGSVGYYFTGKVNVQLADGTILKLQLGCNATVIGSKEAPTGE